MILIILAVLAGCIIFAVALRISEITYQGNDKCSEEEIESYLLKKIWTEIHLFSCFAHDFWNIQKFLLWKNMM